MAKGFNFIYKIIAFVLFYFLPANKEKKGKSLS